MDPRQHSQDYAANPPQRAVGNFGYPGVQNDSFSSFVNADSDSAFDPPWNSQAFPTHQQPVNGFDTSNHAWQQNPYPSSNLLQMPNYGLQSRSYDQAYSRSPASFSYPGFGSNPSQVFSPSAYNSSLDYGQMPINNNPPYDYTNHPEYSQNQETISPQALQNYPIFPQIAPEDRKQVCKVLPLALHRFWSY